MSVLETMGLQRYGTRTGGDAKDAVYTGLAGAAALVVGLI